MQVIRKISELRELLKQWKKEDKNIGLVPTMGALHEGHLSLIKKSVEAADKTVVSVFVNPIQFGQNEDFDKYPKTFEADKSLCEDNGVDVMFYPEIKELYPDGVELSNKNLTYIIPPYSITDKLCGLTRTGHFDGVATVVGKLFNIVQPDFAFFGEKDYQQLKVIKKMVRDLNFDIDIIGLPIVREESGLALSSRNKYLSEEDKKEALTLSKSLFKIKSLVDSGIKDTQVLFDEALNVLSKDVELEYLEFSDEESFETLKKVKVGQTRVLIAGKINGVRLIDNQKI